LNLINYKLITYFILKINLDIGIKQSIIRFYLNNKKDISFEMSFFYGVAPAGIEPAS